MRAPVSRRSFLSTLAAMGGGALLAGCGATAAPQVVKETVVVEQVVTATAAPSSGHAVVRWASSIDAGMLEPTQAECTAYSEANPDVTVVLEPLPWSGYSEKMVTMVAGGAAPDVTTLHPTWVSFFAEHDVTIALDEMATADAEFAADDFFEQVTAYFHYGGKQFGYPYTSWPTVTYFNKTLFEDKGVALPTEFMEGYEDMADDWDWDTLLELAQPMTTGDGVNRTFGLSSGYGAVPSSLSQLNQIIFSYGGEVWNEEMTQTLLCQQEAIDAITFQAELITKHNVAPTSAQSEGIPAGINGGAYGMWLWNRSEVPGFMNVEFEVGMAPYPHGPAGRVLRDGPSGIAITSTSKVIPEAWGFLKHMTGPKPGELGGQKYQFENHYAIPSRKSLFDNEVFTSNLLPWEDGAILKDAASRVRAMPTPARYSEIDKVYREQWEAIVLGQATVEEALALFCESANELLQSS